MTRRRGLIHALLCVPLERKVSKDPQEIMKLLQSSIIGRWKEQLFRIQAGAS